MSDAIARMFDLVPTVSGGYIIRATEAEVRYLHSVWHAMRRTIGNVDDCVSPLAADLWIRMCNEVVDRHILRKPLTRSGT